MSKSIIIFHIGSDVFPDGIPQCAEELHWAVSEEFTSVERTETSLRHLRQVSSLLHLLQQEGLMQGSLSYVEFGAGKGEGKLCWCITNIKKLRKQHY